MGFLILSVFSLGVKHHLEFLAVKFPLLKMESLFGMRHPETISPRRTASFPVKAPELFLRQILWPQVLLTAGEPIRL